MSALLKNLLGHLAPRFQPTSSTHSVDSDSTTRHEDVIPHVDEPLSACDLLMSCVRGRRTRPEEFSMRPARHVGIYRSESDARFEATMAAMRVI